MKEDMLDDLAKSTLVMEGGYKVLTREGVLDIYKKYVAILMPPLLNNIEECVSFVGKIR